MCHCTLAPSAFNIFIRRPKPNSPGAKNDYDQRKHLFKNVYVIFQVRHHRGEEELRDEEGQRGPPAAPQGGRSYRALQSHRQPSEAEQHRLGPCGGSLRNGSRMAIQGMALGWKSC